MRGELTRGQLTAALAVWAVAFGAVAWLLLGPVWAIAGVLVGALVGVIVQAVVRVYATTDAALLLRNGQPDEAIAQLRRELASWRALARIWPSRFRDALASR
jgi:multisubunit Na+/H+ antiporter MnhE subunit